ncbi:hypothetical protein NEOLEDRAFT_1158829 [Neolentinus lepideus HHB14362 ss-1]|uniref:Oxidoreductase AflY n=1 Tax=Neolentinus lepideus HHB14362 ss-1 TaxID=1314782 RepID=A0A165NRZ7_9AGAM|nr:hypothetical protein NEOLEDRAFT_1158829 [Neolentinus lepideus HHB14362 ss-1]
MTGESKDNLYTSIGSAPSPLCPQRWPGSDHEAEKTLLWTLKDNHEKWHTFFNDEGFHNHATHHLLAKYALGATGPLIKASYDVDASYQRPAIKSPEPVGVQNFASHLCEQEYYSGYLKFFTSVLLEKGIPATLEEFIFSNKYNYDSQIKDDDKQPRLLSRFLSGVFHPFIHTGYGVEFDLIGQVAEGLAQTAVHEAGADKAVPLSYFRIPSAGVASSAVSRLTSALPSLSLTPSSQSVQTTGESAFSILSRLLADPVCILASMGPTAGKTPVQLDGIVRALVEKSFEQCGDIVREAAEEWLPVSGPEPSEETLNQKMEEMIWTTVALYAICGWSNAKQFNADFFLMHLVTSSLFLPSFLAPSVLPMSSRRLLLHSYFSTCISTWISRGRPALAIRDFMARTEAHPTPPGPKPEPHKGALPPNDKKLQVNANAWLPIIQATLVHPDDHLCKTQRALAHFAVLYGNRPKGYWKNSAAHNLDGLEELDGTLFVRAAALTADRLGWIIEGKEMGRFDFDGFFGEESA